MYVELDLDSEPARVTLREPEDFKAFKLVVAGQVGLLVEAIQPVGRLDRTDHAFLEPEAILDLAGGLASDPTWREGFAAMLAYAASKGWTDDAGAIRAHIERCER